MPLQKSLQAQYKVWFGARPILCKGERKGGFDHVQENQADIPGGNRRIGSVRPCIRDGCDTGSSKEEGNPRVQAGPKIRLETDSARPGARAASLGGALLVLGPPE